MENEEIIKSAVEIVKDNNAFIKVSAQQQAFIIKADDGYGIPDTFVTVKGNETADDWSRAFGAAGFKSITVTPFKGAGNLSITDVNPDFLLRVQERAKWQHEHRPEGIPNPFFDHNPYAGRDIKFDSADHRLSSSYSHDSSNEYQDYLFQKVLTPKDKIFAGWYDGSLIDWILKLQSIDDKFRKILENKYAYLYGNALLQDYLLKNRDIDPRKFEPKKFEIKSLGIKMYSVLDILSASSLELDEFPETLVIADLDKILKEAQEHKFHKQYQQSDFDNMLNTEISQQQEKDRKTFNYWTRIIRGL